MKSKVLALVMAAGALATGANAQKHKADSLMRPMLTPTPVHKFYFSNGLDAAIFSTSNMQLMGESSKLTTLRFSYVINIGFNANYDFTDHFGVMAGLSMKNIGFIEKVSDSTVKRRAYTIGIPVAIKFGNIPRRNYGFIGGGFDIPFEYKEKGFTSRGSKTKLNSWFSGRTENFMGYVFAGFSVHPGLTFKFQYYPGNFLNRDYVDGSGAKPYYRYEKTNLMLLSLGLDIHYKKPMHDSHSGSGDDENVTMR